MARIASGVQGKNFPWPPITPDGSPPSWDGTAFVIAGEPRPVLEYSRNESAWDASLTGLHEEAASCDHPIDLASRRAAVGALRARLSRPDVILEVGSSSGFLLPPLRVAFPESLVIGSDAFPEGLYRLAGTIRGYPLLQFDLVRCPLPDACVDGLVALNVLEHIEDDRTAVEQMHRVLKPGGLAYVEVPAGPSLYGIYDEMLRHHRRYSARQLAVLASRAGFAIEYMSHLGFLVFPLFALTKRRQQRLMRKTAEDKRARVRQAIASSRRSRGLAFAFRAEAQLGRWLRYPFGIRCVAVLRKPT